MGLNFIPDLGRVIKELSSLYQLLTLLVSLYDMKNMKIRWEFSAFWMIGVFSLSWKEFNKETFESRSIIILTVNQRKIMNRIIGQKSRGINLSSSLWSVKGIHACYQIKMILCIDVKFSFQFEIMNSKHLHVLLSSNVFYDNSLNLHIFLTQFGLKPQKAFSVD